MSETTNLPDNLKSRIARLFVASKEFTDSNNQVVKYKRLVIQVLVKGETFDIEFKPESKDLAILALADIIDQPQLGEQE